MFSSSIVNFTPNSQFANMRSLVAHCNTGLHETLDQYVSLVIELCETIFLGSLCYSFVGKYEQQDFVTRKLELCEPSNISSLWRLGYRNTGITLNNIIKNI